VHFFPVESFTCVVLQADPEMQEVTPGSAYANLPCASLGGDNPIHPALNDVPGVLCQKL